MRLLAHQVVALAGVAHGQYVVGKPGRFVPGGRKRNVALDLALVAQRLHPYKAVGIRPQRVVDAREVDVDGASLLLEHVREQKAHFVVGNRPLIGELELVPCRARGW